MLSPQESPWLREINQYVEDNLGNPDLLVSDLADAMNVSDRHFYRIWYHHVPDLTPLQYLRAKRLECARVLLENGEVETITRLAYEVGYLRTDYFVRLYKQQFGYSPKDLLQNQKNNRKRKKAEPLLC